MKKSSKKPIILGIVILLALLFLSAAFLFASINQNEGDKQTQSEIPNHTTMSPSTANVQSEDLTAEASDSVTTRKTHRDPVLLMVDNDPVNERVQRAFGEVGCQVDIVFDADRIDVESYDALIIPGGNNMDPSSYGEQWHPSTHDTDAAKDALQIKAVKEFVKAKKPVLGICRGAQVINVALGGTLRQNLDLAQNESVYHKNFQTILNKKNSWAYQLYGETCDVYQYHHQCIGVLGEGLYATSNSYNYPYEHIEAFEHESLPIYGVQWHPDCKLAKQGYEFFESFRGICLQEMQK